MRHQPDHLASPCARWVRAYARGRARAHAHREALPARATHRQCALHICIVFSWNCADCRRSCEVGGSWGNDISSRPMQSPVRGARRESCSSCITVACTQAARWKLLRLPKRSGSTLLRAAVLERCTTSITARRAMRCIIVRCVGCTLITRRDLTVARDCEWRARIIPTYARLQRRGFIDGGGASLVRPALWLCTRSLQCVCESAP